jgi:hypothetical protein
VLRELLYEVLDDCNIGDGRFPASLFAEHGVSLIRVKRNLSHLFTREYNNCTLWEQSVRHMLMIRRVTPLVMNQGRIRWLQLPMQLQLRVSERQGLFKETWEKIDYCYCGYKNFFFCLIFRFFDFRFSCLVPITCLCLFGFFKHLLDLFFRVFSLFGEIWVCHHISSRFLLLILTLNTSVLALRYGFFDNLFGQLNLLILLIF